MGKRVIENAPSPSSNGKQNKTLIRRILFTLIALFCVAAVIVLADYYVVFDTIIGLSYQPSREIATIFEHIDLTSKGERILRASRAELQNAENFNTNCSNSTSEISVLGCYYDWRIYIYNIKNEELDGIKETVLAHELLHAVWQREKSWAKDELKSLLRETYDDYKNGLEEHMKNYSDENFVDELHSVIGTQIEPSSLPIKLRNHYAEIFRNHGQIVAYFDKYNDKFLSLRKKLSETSTKINSMKKEIESKRATYHKKTKTLSDDIDIFNSNAAHGYYNNNKTQLDYDRTKLVARQDALNEEFQELNVLINETNKLIEEYNRNVARSNELYGSINSNIKKVDSVGK